MPNIKDRSPSIEVEGYINKQTYRGGGDREEMGSLLTQTVKKGYVRLKKL